jgi:hypothetical protein
MCNKAILLLVRNEMPKPSAFAGLTAEIASEEESNPSLTVSKRSTEPARPRRGRRRNDEPLTPGTREMRKAMTFFFPPEVSEALREIAFHERTTKQALVGEAIDLLMKNRNRHPFGAR